MAVEEIVRDSPEMEQQRRLAAEILKQGRDEIVRRWLEKVRLLTHERGMDGFVKEHVLGDEAREFVDMLVFRLTGSVPEGENAVFYHLILDGQQYNVRLADIAYVLLEFKGVSEEYIFENVGNELQAFRAARLVDDAIEAVLRTSADLYELASEADHKTAQERLQEIFAAWDLEEALTAAQSPAQVCRLAQERLNCIWNLAGLRMFLTPTGEEETYYDLEAGEELPVALVEETPGEGSMEAPGRTGTIDLLEQVRSRRSTVICQDVAECPELVNSAELLIADVHSLACCPLIARDRVLGALMLYGREKGTFRPADGRRLRDFAGVLALAFERTRRMEHSHKAISEAEVISRIGRSLLELPTGKELLQGVAEALRAFRDYYDLCLYRLSRDRSAAHLVAEAGRLSAHFSPDASVTLEDNLLSRCVRSKQTVCASIGTGGNGLPQPLIGDPAIESELAVPIFKGSDVLGLLHVSSERVDGFPENDVAALENVAPHIGVALENARMIYQRQHDRYELEVAHRQLANIIRSAAVGITSIDPNGTYTHWSPSCEELLGYSAEEVVGRKTPVDFAAEPFDLRATLDECLQTGRVTQARRMLRKDGRARIVRETRVPMEDEHGRHIGFTSYLVDITEQRRAEDELRRERDTLNLVVDAMGAGLALFDRDLRMLWANTALMRWFDFGADAVGQECRHVYGCNVGEVNECLIRRAVRSQEPQTRTFEYTDSRGVWHYYQQVCTPVEHGDTRLVALTFDITEQRRQTEQVRLLNKLTEKVETTLNLDRVMHLVLTCLTAGHAIGFNRAFIFLVDETGSALEGRMAVGPISEHDAHRIWSSLGKSDGDIVRNLDETEPSESDKALTDRVSRLRVPLWEEDDTLVSTFANRASAHVGEARSDPHMHREVVEWLELEEFVCVPLAVPDEPIGVVLADNKYSRAAIDQDQVELVEMFARQASLAIANARAYEKIRDQLRELRETRDRLIEAERMASVGRMAGHLAHEIRNPLTAIGGFARRIASSLSPGSEEHAEARIIYDEVKRLERTLVNVLDYTKPLKPRRERVSLNAIVEETLQQSREQTLESGVHVDLALDPDLPDIMADPGMVKQVVLNIIKNAAEALDARPDAVLAITTEAGDGEVSLTVADNGPGMSDETMKELFSPFFTTKIGGVGLGLSVSQRIVRQHGGRIRVASRLGEGSRFTVTLATEEPEDASPGDAAASAQAAKGGL